MFPIRQQARRFQTSLPDKMPKRFETASDSSLKCTLIHANLSLLSQCRRMWDKPGGETVVDQMTD